MLQVVLVAYSSYLLEYTLDSLLLALRKSGCHKQSIELIKYLWVVIASCNVHLCKPEEVLHLALPLTCILA